MQVAQKGLTMKSIYLYWVHQNTTPRMDIIQLIETTLNASLRVEWGKDCSALTIDEGTPEMVSTLLSLQDIVSSDYPVPVSLYITPRLDLFFENYAVSHAQIGIHDLGRLIMMAVQQGQLTIMQVKNAFSPLTKEQRDTIIAYLWSGFNASLAARQLYLHRNSYTYRLNQLIDSTGWEIRYAHVILFLNWWLFL